MSYICKINGRIMNLASPVTFQEYKESYGVFRLKVTSDIIFRDNKNKGITDYTYIKTLEASHFNNIHTLEIYSIVEPRKHYHGAFKIQDCSFNPLENQVTVKHTIWDLWAKIQAKSDVKINILSGYKPFGTENIKDLTGEVYTKFEFIECTIADFNFPDDDYYASLYIDFRDEHSDPEIIIYYIEKVTIERGYVMDATWTILSDNDNSITYIRKPPEGYGLYTSDMIIKFSDFYTLSDVEQHGETHIFAVPKPGAPSIDSIKINSDWTLVYEGSLELYDGTDPDWEHHETWELKDFPFIVAIKKFNYNNKISRGFNINYKGIELRSFISQIFSVGIIDFEGEVKSTFLFNDHGATGEIDRYNPDNIDYVAGKIIYDKYVILKPDFIRPSANMLSQKFEMSLKDIIDDLKNMFAFLYDYLDTDGNYRIEHIAYLNTITGISINSERLPINYEYISNNVLNREIFEMIDSGNSDFARQEIIYPDVLPVDGKENVNTYGINFIATDVEYMASNIDEISQSGIILVQVENNSFNSWVGLISGNYMLNSSLSISALVNNYYGYLLYRNRFTIFGIEKESFSLAKIRSQECEFITDQYIDIRKTLTTRLGIGEIETLEYNTADDNHYKAKVNYE